MKSPTRRPASFSTVSVKGQTVLPGDVRDRLGIKPRDILRYRLTENGVLIDKASSDIDDPFTPFSEWSSAADKKAYDRL